MVQARSREQGKLDRGRKNIKIMNRKSFLNVEGVQDVMKIWFAVGCAMLFIIAEATPVFATAAVEYGILSSKPMPRSGKVINLDEKINGAMNKNNAPAKQGGKKVRKGDKSRAAGKSSGPLILERRGNHFERVH